MPYTVESVLIHGTRLLSAAAALVVMYIEFTGSAATRRLLVGVSTPLLPSNAYDSLYLPLYLSTLVASQESIKAMDASFRRPFVAYLDMNDTTNTLAFQPSACNQAGRSPADPIYDIDYARPLLDNILANFPAFDWPSNDTTIVVDCSFFGRTIGDTTTAKLYLLNETTLTTLVVQTIAVSRPTQQRVMAAGLAMFTTTPLSTLVVDDACVVTATEAATYAAAVGFGFPYEWAPFVPITLEATVPTVSTEWMATMISTGERISFAGTMGIYRIAPSSQANYDYYIWDMPQDPLAFVAHIQYANAHVLKDVHGWFRCFLGLGIGFNIALHMAVALMVMGRHAVVTRQYIPFPNVYAAIQKRATARVVLLVADCVLHDWWYPFQYALNQGNVRTGLLVGTLPLVEMPRADGLMLCLALTYLAAAAARVRVELFVVVAIYLVAFSYRIELVARYGVALDATNLYLEANFLENVQPGNGTGMDIWTCHVNTTTNFTLLWTEFTWLVLATAATLGYVVLVKLYRCQRWLGTVKVTPADLATLKALPEAWTVPMAGKRQSNGNGGRHWSIRSRLYDGVTIFDTENTHVERSVGRVAADMVGFVTWSVDYCDPPTKRMTTIRVSPCGLWLLGYVVVHDRFLVGINDHLFLLLNVLFHVDYFRIYGFHLDKTGTSVCAEKTHVHHHHLTWSQCWTDVEVRCRGGCHTCNLFLDESMSKPMYSETDGVSSKPMY
ncbi:Aste57867_17024 [Aphanomyces stellatus]|uniref:Aste57867_17024 protein n=1 Tax=Aphanomyces stellatus TaxID=120398 RepID=A0A485L7Q3_9STRA|nr:hypothetical protein As57867_016966 [Aphanomyces stellatus]VFT93785.1 Aste57867_17024 [Aphanomyces stellatus]